MDIDVRLECQQRGFFPRGGGRVLMQTQPLSTLRAFELTKRGRLQSVAGHVVVAGRGYAPSMGDAVVRGAERELRRAFGNRVTIKLEVLRKLKADSRSDGVGVVLVAETDTGCLFGGSALLDPPRRRGKGNSGAKLEELGRVAARALATDWNSTKRGCTELSVWC